MRAITLIGAPTDVGASVLGASMGPEAMRIAGIAQALRARDLKVLDIGNLVGPGNPQSPAHGGFRHLDEVVAWNRTLYAATLDTLAAGRLPLMMGGDHCLAIGSISAVAQHCRSRQKRLKVLWFDAHADSNTPQTSPSGNLHGMPVACLLGHGPSALTQLTDTFPVLRAAQIAMIGIRSVDASEKHFVNEHHIDVYDMRTIDEMGMRAVMQSVLSDVDENTHLHLSFDMDFLDPGVAPGVGTPVRGGPTYRETQLCMEMLADSGALASVDLVELNPALDIRNQTAELAVELLESLFGKSTLMREPR
ncbi:arginase [Diaphorobacter aerolatus]|uniref:Arginase n=1 Tax=Diaphorobacter aerolatus TaxID=1288495 RepID=A0A7H0GFQ8_9BURK|nr:arginase [Diaphorobacter aerolatus]QNP47124.1 arginase [Diaphorobacter aerolatus]